MEASKSSSSEVVYLETLRRNAKDGLGDSKSSSFNMIRFIFEACIKLESAPMTTATAACIYHRFYQQFPECNFDKQLVAAVSVYLAGKVEENHLKIRDVINVCHKMVHPNLGPLELDVEYYDLRDSFTQLELLMLRVLRFQVNFSHPHKYLLNYAWSISHWVGLENVWQSSPVLSTSWAFIQDLLHDPIYLTFKPQHLAIGALYLAFQVYGITFPHEDEASIPWYRALCDDLDEDKIWDVVTAIIKNYRQETSIRT